MNTGIWVAVLVIAGLLIWFALPKEEFGTKHIDGAVSCQTEVQVKQNSPQTYFKTFICSTTPAVLGTGISAVCDYYVMENDVCVKNYYYVRTLDE